MPWANTGERTAGRRCVPVRLLLVAATVLLAVRGGGVGAQERTPAGFAPDAPGFEIEVFTRSGCPRCVAAEGFLDSLRRQRPELRIVEHRIDADPVALRQLKDLSAAAGMTAVGVPTFRIGGELVVGFVSEESTGARIRALLERRAGTGGDAGVACATETADGCAGAEDVGSVTVPILGAFDLRNAGLPLFTVVLGLLDGFNPCAMWVLLFLLSLLVNVHSRTRMLLVAGTFVAASGLVYFAFMAAWLNVFLLVGFSGAVRVVLGLVATAVGALNVKDFFAFGRGVSVSIPAAAKPQLYARARRVLQAENLPAALAAVVVLAVFVNSVELLCTAGFPAVYTHVLSRQGLPWWEHYGYLLLYNLAYMLDDGIMVATAVVTLERFKLQERGGRWLKLLSGTVLLALGLALLVRPTWVQWG